VVGFRLSLGASRMHVHLPKPLHGWRAFVGEVGIIVLGVLIALGFEQMVEEWRWHQQVATARQALANELAGSANQGAERISVEYCLRDRIGELAAKLNTTQGRWTADPMLLARGTGQSAHLDVGSIARVYGTPLRGWSQDAWDTAKSTGVLNHMHHEEVASYSAVYGEIAAIRDFELDELPLESELSFLSVDQQLDNQSRINALGRLAQLDALNATIAGLSSLMIQQIKGLHLRVDRTDFSKSLKETIEVQREYRGSCVKDVRVDS
jgi:hypothetical protein